MKEKEQYKSAQFIEDSDEEYGNMEDFLEKEKLQREKAILAAAAEGVTRPPTMKSAGTKKRHRKGVDGSTSKKRKGNASSTHNSEAELNKSDESEVEVVSITRIQPASSSGEQHPKPTPRIRPRPHPKRRESVLPSSSPIALPSHGSLPSSPSQPNLEPETMAGRSNRNTKRLILSDDED